MVRKTIAQGVPECFGVPVVTETCSFTLIGPAVQIYTPMHPLNAELRRREEFGKPIEIGSDVWLAAAQSFSPMCGSDRER